LHPVPGHGLTGGGMEDFPITIDTEKPTRDWVRVEACTLPTLEQPMRIAEFDELFVASLRDIQEPGWSDVKVRLVLGGDEVLPERVQRLVDAETSCCSFFTFTLTPLELGDSSVTETMVALDIDVPAARADVLAAFVSRARGAQEAS
jgi:hypothetical protein